MQFDSESIIGGSEPESSGAETVSVVAKVKKSAKKPTPKVEVVKLKPPSIFSFRRGIEVGLFSMFSVSSTEQLKELPVAVETRTARGTISNYSSDSPESRSKPGEKSISNANIQRIEDAQLPTDRDTLLVKGSVRFVPNTYVPAMVDAVNNEFQTALERFIDAYAQKAGFKELALRYALNIVTGRWLWRNLFGDNRVVTISIPKENFQLALREDEVDMGNGFCFSAIAESKRAAFQEFVALIEAALATKGGNGLRVDLAATIELGFGALVYPSQEFNAVQTTSREPALSKTLAKVRREDGVFQAVFSPQKTGNAIRTIDTWHGVEGVGAIAVEPYGVNTHVKAIHRITGNDLYSYLKDPVLLLEQLNNAGIQDHHHFTVACLVRGGGYSMAEKKEKV